MQVISEELGLKLEKVELGQLGRAKKVTISKDDTVVLNGAGEKQALIERCDQIRESIEMSTSDYDREKLQERLAKLSGGVAVLKVGGASEVSVLFMYMLSSTALPSLSRGHTSCMRQSLHFLGICIDMGRYAPFFQAYIWKAGRCIRNKAQSDVTDHLHALLHSSRSPPCSAYMVLGGALGHKHRPSGRHPKSCHFGIVRMQRVSLGRLEGSRQ